MKCIYWIATKDKYLISHRYSSYENFLLLSKLNFSNVIRVLRYADILSETLFFDACNRFKRRNVITEAKIRPWPQNLE